LEKPCDLFDIKKFFHRAQKMKYFFHPIHSLTEPMDRLGILLILLFFLTFPVRVLSANDSNGIFTGDPRSNNAIDTAMQDQQRMAVLDYVRKQTFGLVTSMPNDDVRTPVNWFIRTFQNSRGLLSFGLSDLDEEEELRPTRPPANLAQPMVPGYADDQWLASTTFHHHSGFLPTHDALMAGAHAKQGLFDQYVQYDLHPYVAQNYFSSRNYYGADLSLNFAKPANTSELSRPWGTLVIGYANGDSQLTDYGRGIDLHGELHFNDQLSLNSGVRQSDPSGDNNYIMLQWKISTE
jgi:hypothetical protein